MEKYAFTFPSLASAGWYVDMMIEIGATMFFTRWKPHVEDGWSPTQKESGALNDLQRRTTISVILLSPPHQEGRSTCIHGSYILRCPVCWLVQSHTEVIITLTGCLSHQSYILDYIEQGITAQEVQNLSIKSFKISETYVCHHLNEILLFHMSFSKECADLTRPIGNIQAADLATIYTAHRNTQYNGLQSLINFILTYVLLNCKCPWRKQLLIFGQLLFQHIKNICSRETLTCLTVFSHFCTKGKGKAIFKMCQSKTVIIKT